VRRVAEAPPEPNPDSKLRPPDKLGNAGAAAVDVQGVCSGFVYALTVADAMIQSGAAQRALVVGDMPFMSYQVSVEQAVTNAGRLIQEGGASAVKLEGGARMADRVQAIVQAGIPVMGHIGLTPQSVHQFGGYKVQGKNYLDSRQIRQDARDLQNAGIFALVMEGIPGELAEEITAELKIPTIGIGAGLKCDGQILVLHDLLGLNQDFVPKFVKQYAQLADSLKSAVSEYIQEVRNETFPGQEHTYHAKRGVLKQVND